ncbi:MAG: LD-carboxypeptidase [Flavobacteriales bacterium]|nr:LD-carboxypeptidase [Flavobacteriales bacterium]
MKRKEKPQSLVVGDKIGLLSTARKITLDELDFALKLIKNWGLVPVLGNTISESDNQFAGTVEKRINDFQNFLDNPEIRAILCVRGGYGTVQIIDSIDFSEFTKNSKWIIGYSDVTVLHCHINRNLNIQTLHASMPVNFSSNTSQSLESIKFVLFGTQLKYKINSHKLNRVGVTSGELVGGNLSIIYSLSGSNSQLITDGKILFIEDLDEYLYHIDRMMMNLKRSKLLENLSGLIVGGMTDMKDNSVSFGKNAYEIIADALKEYDFPIAFDFPAGHLNDNRALIIGSQVKFSVTHDSTELIFID